MPCSEHLEATSLWSVCAQQPILATAHASFKEQVVKRPLLILALVGAMAGTVTAHASVVTFDAVLNGANESPANASPGTGFAKVIFDSVAHTMRVQVSLSAPTAAPRHRPRRPCSRV